MIKMDVRFWSMYPRNVSPSAGTMVPKTAHGGKSLLIPSGFTNQLLALPVSGLTHVGANSDGIASVGTAVSPCRLNANATPVNARMAMVTP